MREGTDGARGRAAEGRAAEGRGAGGRGPGGHEPSARRERFGTDMNDHD